MRFIQNKYFPYFLLVVCSIPLFFILISDVHSWGDDFAQYIKEAQNIAHGKPFYQSGYIYNKYNTEYAPPYYPPGFPLLIAPVVKIWGLAIRPLLYAITIFSACLLFALFGYFRKHTSVTTALCLAVAVTYSCYLIDLKANILSDIPCLLFIVLYLTARNARSFPWQRIVVLVFFATAAILIRSQAILLLLAEGVYLFISLVKDTIKHKRFHAEQLYRSPSLYIIAGSLLINFILNKIVFSAPVDANTFYGQFVQRLLNSHIKDVASTNINRILPDLTAFFHYPNHEGFLREAMYFVENAAVTFSIIGFLICIRKRLVVDDIFFMLMCLMVIFLFVHDQRYFLPVLPLLFFYSYITFKIIVPAITNINGRWVGILVTLLYLRLGLLHLSACREVPAGCIPQPQDRIAFQYIADHVSDRDIIIFTKPRLLTLYTNKRTINVAWQIPPGENKKLFDSLQAKYMLVVDGLDDGYFREYLRNTQHPLDSVRFGERYTLYSLR